MKNIESAFNELGIDAVVGTELMDWLGVSAIDLGDPQRFSKFQSVIGYFKQFPVDTQRFIIRKAVNGKNVDKLQHIWEYSELLKNKKAVEESLEKIKVEASAVGTSGDAVLRMANAEREIEANRALGQITDEIRLYEK